jgi:hypothetical protein
MSTLAIIALVLLAWVLLATAGGALVWAIVERSRARLERARVRASGPERRVRGPDRRVGLPDPRPVPVERRSGWDRRQGPALPA